MSETPAEKAEARAIRRRWINIGELVAVVGVIIAGVSLWLSWADRRADDQAKQATEAAATRDKTRFEMRGKVTDNGRSIDLLRDDDHALSEVEVSFPQALGIAAQDAVGHKIDARWIEGALLKATDGGADVREGRLPVLVRYTYLTDDKPMTASAIYEVVWMTEGRVLRGRTLKLIDFRRREGATGNNAARLDTLWAVEAKRLGIGG